MVKILLSLFGRSESSGQRGRIVPIALAAIVAAGVTLALVFWADAEKRRAEDERKALRECYSETVRQTLRLCKREITEDYVLTDTIDGYVLSAIVRFRATVYYDLLESFPDSVLPEPKLLITEDASPGAYRVLDTYSTRLPDELIHFEIPAEKSNRLKLRAKERFRRSLVERGVLDEMSGAALSKIQALARD